MIRRPPRSTLFPYRRSSDLPSPRPSGPSASPFGTAGYGAATGRALRSFSVRKETKDHGGGGADRKSTRLNSSHMSISYAVFCLKKKKLKVYNNRLHVDGCEL